MEARQEENAKKEVNDTKKVYKQVQYLLASGMTFQEPSQISTENGSEEAE